MPVEGFLIAAQFILKAERMKNEAQLRVGKFSLQKSGFDVTGAFLTTSPYFLRWVTPFPFFYFSDSLRMKMLAVIPRNTASCSAPSSSAWLRCRSWYHHRDSLNFTFCDSEDMTWSKVAVVIVERKFDGQRIQAYTEAGLFCVSAMVRS